MNTGQEEHNETEIRNETRGHNETGIRNETGGT